MISPARPEGPALEPRPEFPLSVLCALFSLSFSSSKVNGASSKDLWKNDSWARAVNHGAASLHLSESSYVLPLFAMSVFMIATD